MQKPSTRKPRITAAAALASLLVLAACGTEKAGTDPGADTVAPDVPVTGVHWAFDSVTVAGKTTRAPAGAHVEIEKNGRAKGNSGCNHFGAAVAVNGDTLTVSMAETTEMGCPAELQSFESTLWKAFSGTLKAKLEDDRLTLTAPDGTATLALSSEPAAPLNGTTWTVDSLLSGDTAASLPQDSEGKAHFVIDKDGKVRGSLGCNRFSTTAKISGRTIDFGEITTTRMMCTGPEMKLETELYEVFGGSATYELSHRALTLTTADGKGFGAVAKPPAKG
ncbi:META domain-containing protein [Streptomyces sp. ISL-36]|uniref:META domain-containing protein n=1 Tax=Streptomyces sp. ISL-36 TaxID=2819182 RepID=UPI001BEA1D3F|nr:META domain-containing protein [Streptomyces sp. ISL-36]MBT2439001.1 META domain-containing protein [Streptomyces sp. ISL-36]